MIPAAGRLRRSARASDVACGWVACGWWRGRLPAWPDGRRDARRAGPRASRCGGGWWRAERMLPGANLAGGCDRQP